MKIINDNLSNQSFRRKCPLCGSEIEYDATDCTVSGNEMKVICPRCGHMMNAIGEGVTVVKWDEVPAATADAASAEKETVKLKALEPGKWYVLDSSSKNIYEKAKIAIANSVWKCTYPNVIENPYTGQVTDLTYAPETIGDMRELTVDKLKKGYIVAFSPSGSKERIVAVLDSVSGDGPWKVTCECLLTAGISTEIFTQDKETYHTDKITIAEAFEYIHYKSVLFHHGLKLDKKSGTVVTVTANTCDDITAHEEPDDETAAEQPEPVPAKQDPQFAAGDYIINALGKPCRIAGIDGGMYRIDDMDNVGYSSPVDYIDRTARRWDSSMLNEGDYVVCTNKDFSGVGIFNKRTLYDSLMMYVYLCDDENAEPLTDPLTGEVIIRADEVHPASSNEISAFNKRIEEEHCRWNPESKTVEEFYDFIFKKNDVITKDNENFMRIDSVEHDEANPSQGKYVCSEMYADKDEIKSRPVKIVLVTEQDDYKLVDKETLVRRLVYNGLYEYVAMYRKHGTDSGFGDMIAGFAEDVLCRCVSGDDESGDYRDIKDCIPDDYPYFP